MVPHEAALAIRDDVAFFQAAQSVLAKRAPGEERPGGGTRSRCALDHLPLQQKLLKGELAIRCRKNKAQARSFAEMLEQTIRCYQNRAIEAAQAIEELLALAKEMREANARRYVELRAKLSHLLSGNK